MDIQPSTTRAIRAQDKTTNEHKSDYPTSKSIWVHQACNTKAILFYFSLICQKPILAGLAGYIFSDLITGVYHWSIDNYGDAKTPIFGSQIEGFQGHHEKPWIITRKHIATNLYELSQIITLIFLPINLICNNPILLAFVGSLSTGVLFCQQFHAWSHTTNNKLPTIVVALQDLGVLVSRSQHAAHHHALFNSNYCIVSGIWNNFLDEIRVFEAFEKVIFFWFGVKPRSWNELT
ncbi:fatty acid desaturase 4, chloroplastic-like [Chenopodium quinoa]|uniref:fatty acid desaturase 4, chloroplastic-like n=1 Tax=Chenopodium quinoa TaxID=63459 RepID=UPI000B789630|nr:fatty acid desaturase 4, chloroplastic-like [Chenopodium quinoa]